MTIDMVTLVFPARTEYLVLPRLALAGIVPEAGIDQATLADLKLAVTEACGNAIRHAGPKRDASVTVRFAVDDRSIDVRVEDNGPGMQQAEPVRPASELSESGMGLGIIQALVDDLEISAPDRGPGTIVRLRRSWTDPIAGA